MSSASPSPAARPASLDAVFAHAWQAAEFTASDVIAVTGLTRSTAIDAMDTLARAGLLRELPNARHAGDYRKGRPARRFALAEEAGALVGIDAGNEHVTATVADLRSRPLATRRLRLELDRDDGPARAALVAALVDDVLRDAGLARADVLSVCAGVPAPVDRSGRSPRHPTGFWERMNPGLVDTFAWAPLVRIANDASLAAVAEGSIGAAVGCRDYVTLLAGARLGAGVVIDGHLLRGAHGGVGEMVAFAHVLGVGTADGLGARVGAIVADVLAEGAADSALAGLGTSERDAPAVLALAARGDAAALEVADRLGAVLARIVSVLGSMFDPERVVVSGAIAAGMTDVVAAARRALPTDLDLPAPTIALSDLGADVVVRGAVAAAASHARERALDVWTFARP
ncbi:ROK family protein [Microbacterium sp. 10M-3C3]|uniref:ROK family protein n=1 Tax=Microbacterium sp. 10M-3C3 TaxID=2483401 RepID=UPI000F630E2F|nr:ROK family protein [Microbacterium sp. 10M-3C3]